MPCDADDVQSDTLQTDFPGSFRANLFDLLFFLFDFDALGGRARARARRAGLRALGLGFRIASRQSAHSAHIRRRQRTLK